MGAFADLDAVVDRLTGGNSGTPETIFFYKDARIPGAAPTAPVVARWNSLWNVIGVPSHGSYPSGSAVYPTNATDGCLKQADPDASREKWMTGGWATGLTVGTLMLYDRLATYGALDGTVITAQTCTMTLSGRYSGAASVGNQLWVEIGTAIGATARTIVAEYTDQDGNTGVTSEAADIGGTGRNEAGRMLQIPLASGDTGVRAVASVTLSATTGTAGAFAAMIIHPLAYWTFPYAGSISVRDFVAGMPAPIEIETDACLALAWFAGNVTIPTMFGQLTFCED